ncbi:MAG: GTP 3',8-cyclase MoaA [Candidatus Altiarchaeota archaeon]|nr:GTP 3',8-cyclase MoaA [Candidatus Altiarchaeota archaeon]
MKDRFGREVDNLRLAVTSRCNLKCFFCHHEGYTPNICSAPITEGEMDIADIVRVVEVASKYGLTRVKLTGGEPLLRKDLLQIIGEIKKVDGIGEVSLVTNGTFIESQLGALKEVSRVNVSLHTTREAVFEKITGKNLHSKVVRGIKKLVEMKIPVKVNMTVIKNLNEDEVPDMIALAKELKTDLQIIEYHSNKMSDSLNFDISAIQQWLEQHSHKTSELRDNRRRKFKVEGVNVTLVRPRFNPDFCKHCHRLRVTPDGKFKPCLLREDNHVDFDVKRVENVEKAMLDAIQKKEPFFKGD